MEGLVNVLACGGLLVLVCLAAVLRTSLREFSRSRLESACQARGHLERFTAIMARRESAQLVVALGHAVVLVGLVAGFVAWFVGPSGPRELSSQITAGTLATALLLLAEVILPWGLARVVGESLLVRCWWALSPLCRLLGPFVLVARGTDRVFHRIAGRREPTGDGGEVLSDEIRSVVDEGQRGGVLESAARKMIHRVMDLHEEDVAAVMTPRTDMVCIDAEASLEQARRELLAAGHTRVPVVGESTDDIVGILYAKDLLGHLQTDGTAAGPTLREIIREPFYVPETTGIDTLLETLKREQVHLAIVLDEYGGVAGLVTLEDVLEEIVGEIEDEYDEVPGELVRTIGPDEVEIDARAHIDDLNERFDYGLPEDGDFDTLAGFVITRLGRIPDVGEQLEWRDWRLTVHEADKRRVKLVRVLHEGASEDDSPSKVAG